jgi:hypothetical protein
MKPIKIYENELKKKKVGFVIRPVWFWFLDPPLLTVWIWTSSLNSLSLVFSSIQCFMSHDLIGKCNINHLAQYLKHSSNIHVPYGYY